MRPRTSIPNVIQRSSWSVLCILTALTLLVTAYYVNAAYLQLGTMQRQLEATDRPWIQIIYANVTDGLGSYRTYNKRLPGIHVSIKMVAKNVSHAVAVRVRMTGRLIFDLPGDTNYSIWNRQLTVRSTIDPLNTTSEFTLFPEENTGKRLEG